MRDRYVDQLGEELEEELRRDVEAMKGEDEGDFIDAREPPEPFCSPLDEPFRPARALNAVITKRDHRGKKTHRQNSERVAKTEKERLRLL